MIYREYLLYKVPFLSHSQPVLKCFYFNFSTTDVEQEYISLLLIFALLANMLTCPAYRVYEKHTPRLSLV